MVPGARRVGPPNVLASGRRFEQQGLRGRRCDGLPARPWLTAGLGRPQGATEVTAAVYGPSIGGKQEDAEKAVVEVVFRPRAGLPGPIERNYEATIRGLVEGACLLSLHPRCCISGALLVALETVTRGIGTVRVP